MTEKERDIVFTEVEARLRLFIPHSQDTYINDTATELTDWILKYIEDKCENCGGLL